jgi:hypothetical protein
MEVDGARVLQVIADDADRAMRAECQPIAFPDGPRGPS